MKHAYILIFLAGAVAVGSARAEQSTPAEQKIAIARQEIAASPKKAEAYNDLALALIARARETDSADYDREATEAIRTGFSLAPKDYQLRKTHVVLLLDQQSFSPALQEARELCSQNRDDAAVRGYLARSEMGLGDYDAAVESDQWSLDLSRNNVPGMVIAGQLRDHFREYSGALDILHRAYQEVSPSETGELAAIANLIAGIEIETGATDRARQTLQTADEVFPDYPETAKTRARLRPDQKASQQDGMQAVMSSPRNSPVLHAAERSPAALLTDAAAYHAVSSVVFSPVPAALMIPKGTGTERIIHNLQSKVQANPKDPGAYSSLGAAFFQRARETGDVEDFQLAEQALNKSLDLDSTDFAADAAYSSMAEVCMGEHRFNDAITYAQKALALGSGDLSSFAIVGDANADMGEYEHAAVAYSRLDVSGEATAQPRNVYVRDSRTSYLKFVSGDTAGAIVLMQHAVEAGTEARLPAENLAWLYFELGEYETQAGDIAAANTAYLTALNIHPGDYRALAGLGKLRGNQGRYPEAIKLYQSAIAVVPMPMFVGELGDLYAKAGNLAEARKQYQLVEYIGMLGHINQVLHNRDLALFYADHDIKLDEALALAHKEFEVRHDVYTWDALAWAFYKNGKYQEANDAAENALRPGTQDALLFFHAGMIAERMGRAAQAKDKLQQALSINPQFHVIYAGVAREHLQTLQGQTALHDQAGLAAGGGSNHAP